ncbi:MAG: GtrA family protein [Hydrotalea sp.]|nr:GtrA family protein [Hydrotalea sp.]
MKRVVTFFANRHFVFYILCGGGGAATDFVAYSGLVWAGVYYLYANVASYMLGTGVSFALNRQFNFKKRDKTWHRLLKFYLVALVGFLVSSAVLFLLVDGMMLDKLSAKIITMGVALVVQFTLNKLFTFAK